MDVLEWETGGEEEEEGKGTRDNIRWGWGWVIGAGGVAGVVTVRRKGGRAARGQRGEWIDGES